MSSALAMAVLVAKGMNPRRRQWGRAGAVLLRLHFGSGGGGGGGAAATLAACEICPEGLSGGGGGSCLWHLEGCEGCG